MLNLSSISRDPPFKIKMLILSSIKIFLIYFQNALDITLYIAKFILYINGGPYMIKTDYQLLIEIIKNNQDKFNNINNLIDLLNTYLLDNENTRDLKEKILSIEYSTCIEFNNKYYIDYNDFYQNFNNLDNYDKDYFLQSILINENSLKNTFSNCYVFHFDYLQYNNILMRFDYENSFEKLASDLDILKNIILNYDKFLIEKTLKEKLIIKQDTKTKTLKI